MKTVYDFPRQVEEWRHVTIEMSDGVKLAARIWLPTDAADNPVPAILEYTPYRQRDGTAPRDALHHPYFAGHGYAGVRVDLRGSGDSEGVLRDEYLEQELVDGEEVIAWLAAQPWCDGKVGMIGISWGGFNGLQLAARRPEGLGAIITVCSTDDRYADDIHYMGGCLLGDNLSWASTMFAYNSQPPDPATVGEKWRELWLERLEGSGLWLEPWLSHQHRDAYWQHGSVCEDFSAIDIPVLAASGWADGYSNAVFRLLEHLDVPRKGLIGPWSHKYPHIGEPGPAVGFLQESVRWWDRWLKDEPNDVMDEPMLRVFMQDSVSPFTSYAERPGRWVGEDSWPSPRVETATFQLSEGRLQRGGSPVAKDDVEDADVLTHTSALSVGMYAGKWCSYAGGPDLPADQRLEDGGSLVFDTPPLNEAVEICGMPEVELTLSVDKPVAMVAARLSEVLPDGKVTRITYGLLNLTHRDSHETPERLVPGERYRVTVSLNGVAQHFSKGNRIRLSLSTSYFPLAWPAPEPVELRVYPVQSRLMLPVRPPQDETVTFDEPEAAPPLEVTGLEPGQHDWYVHRDLTNDTSTLEVIDDRSSKRLEDVGTTVTANAAETYSISGDDVTTARGETVWEKAFQRGDWDARTLTRTVLTCDADYFYIHAQLDAYEGDMRIFSKNWTRRIERDLL